MKCINACMQNYKEYSRKGVREESKLWIVFILESFLCKHINLNLDLIAEMSSEEINISLLHEVIKFQEEIDFLLIKVDYVISCLRMEATPTRVEMTDGNLIKGLILHLGFIRSYDEKTHSLIDSLKGKEISIKIYEQAYNVFRMLHTENAYIEGFFVNIGYDIRSEEEKKLIKLLCDIMTSSLELKARNFKSILNNLSDQCGKMALAPVANKLKTLQDATFLERFEN